MDIRSYFTKKTVKPKKSSSANDSDDENGDDLQRRDDSKKKGKRKPKQILSSDSEDENPIKKNGLKKKKVEDPSPSSAKKVEKQLKTVNPKEFFAMTSRHNDDKKGSETKTKKSADEIDQNRNKNPSENKKESEKKKEISGDKGKKKSEGSEIKKEISEDKGKKRSEGSEKKKEISGHKGKKRSEGSETKKRKTPETEFHNDEDFNAMLVALDEEDFTEPSPKKSRQSGERKEKPTLSSKLSKLSKKEGKDEKTSPKNDKGEETKEAKERSKTDNIRKKKTDEDGKKKSPAEGEPKKSKTKKTPSKRNYELVVDKPTKLKTPPSKSSINDDTDEIPVTPDDYEEKKKQHLMQYRKFLSRGGARNPGCKEIPEHTPDCLKSLVFVLTGVYESLEREEASELIKKCGGKVTTSLSKNTSYLVVGEEAGEAKLKKAQTLGTKTLDEDGLLNLIREKSKNLQTVESKKELLTPKEKTPKREKKPPAVKKEKKETTPPIKEEVKSPLKEDPDQCTEFQLWVEKYKPTSLKSIIGQQGDRSNMKKLLEWLRNWSKYYGPGENKLKPPPRPSPWASGGDSGLWAKCALLSGPPGVGKTTTAYLVSRELGFDVMELNASDARSKKSLDNGVSDALSSTSLSKASKKRVLLMDEVDGMAGNEDRGGVAELIHLIKTSKTPIICMCNDRNHQKIRSLANYCFDLRFQRPRAEQIKAAMMSICFKEKVKIDPDALTEMIIGCNQDVRQVLHHLSMLKVRDHSHISFNKEQAQSEVNSSKKTSIKLGPWDVCKKVFSAQEHKSMSLFDKADLFFHDYSMGPLFVQENYLSVTPAAAKNDKKETMRLVSKAAESLCSADLIEATIRSRNAWSLLPINAMFSSVLPGEYMSGYFHGQIQFPNWLGKYSKQNKTDRILQELTMHTRLSAGANKGGFNLDYSQTIRDSVVYPLVTRGTDGIPEAVGVMESYALLREDLDNLLEISQWPNMPEPMKKVEGKVKAAFTRAYNKEVTTLPYAVVQNNLNKRRKAVDEFQGINEEEILLDNDDDDGEDDNDDITTDAMIKAKTRKADKKPSVEKRASKKSNTASKKTKK